MKNKAVIYTAIFGPYDALEEPRVKPEGFDFVCFTDQPFKSKIWEVRKVTPAYEDSTRNARMYKILPHRYLGGYDLSVWVDGNLVVRGDPTPLIDTYLKDANLAAYNHAHARHRDKERTPDFGDCIYRQAEELLALTSRGRHAKDDPEVIKAQMARYRAEGYPEHHGLILSMALLRKHNEPDVVKAMEGWWDELRKGSKRDQLSFGYVAWKQGLRFNYINDDARNNPYFLHVPHQKHR